MPRKTSLPSRQFLAGLPSHFSSQSLGFSHPMSLTISGMLYSYYDESLTINLTRPSRDSQYSSKDHDGS